MLFVTIPASFGLIFVADDFIRLVYNQDFDSSIVLIQILAIGIPIIAIDTVLATALIAADRVKGYLAVAAIVAFLNPIVKRGRHPDHRQPVRERGYRRGGGNGGHRGMDPARGPALPVARRGRPGRVQAHLAHPRRDSRDGALPPPPVGRGSPGAGDSGSCGLRRRVSVLGDITVAELRSVLSRSSVSQGQAEEPAQPGDAEASDEISAGAPPSQTDHELDPHP